MNASELVKDLKKPNIFTNLHEYNTCLESLESRGAEVEQLLRLTNQGVDLIELLAINQPKLRHYGDVLSIIGTVLFTVAEDLRQYSSCGQHIMHALLHDHMPVVKKIFDNRNEGSVMIPLLRALTAGVLVDEVAASEVVEGMDWSLLSTSAKRREAGVERDARAWTIYFITALLDTSNNIELYTAFLKTGALSIIYPGLADDSADRVISILTLLHDNVVLNADVNKSLKISLFNGTTVRPLLALLERRTSKTKSRKGGDDDTVQEEGKEEEDAARASIAKVVFKLFTPICSSYKFGIVFQSSDTHKTSNGHAYDILKLLPVSVLHDSDGRDLISYTLRACPDIHGDFWKHIKKLVFSNQSKTFLALMNVYCNMVKYNNVHTLILKNIDTIISLLFPVPITGTFVNDLLVLPDLERKYCAISLIHSIVDKSRYTMKKLKRSGKTEAMMKLKSTLCDWLKIAVPSVQPILDVWNMLQAAVQVGEEVRDKMLTVLNVFILYTHFSDSTNLATLIKPGEMLASMLTLPEDDQKLQLIIACLQLINNVQSKFEVIHQARDETLKQQFMDTLKLLFQLYLEVSSGEQREENKFSKILIPLVDHIEQTLVNYGFSSHNEANIKCWLEALPGRDTLCVEFVCNSIITTIASLEEYYDQLVVITRNSTTDQTFNSELAFMEYSNDHEIEDSTDITAANVPLSFSRLILGSVEMLKKSESDLVREYFCDVVKQYIHCLPDPQVLAQYLLTTAGDCITESLDNYCHSWLGRKTEQSPVLEWGETFAHNLDYIFMSKDFKVRKKLLKEISVPQSIYALMDLMKKVLLYLKIDTSDSANVTRRKAIETYVKILEHLIQNIPKKGESDEISRSDMISMILNHPVIINMYDPFTLDLDVSVHFSPFIESLLSEIVKDPASDKEVVNTYFRSLCNELKKTLKTSDAGKTDFWQPFEPFFHNNFNLQSMLGDENSITLFKDFLAAPICFFQSASFLRLILKITQIVSRSVYSRLKSDRHLFQLLLSLLKNSSDQLSTDTAEEASNNEEAVNNTDEKVANTEKRILNTKQLTDQTLLQFLKLIHQHLADGVQAADAANFNHSSLKWLAGCAGLVGCALLLRVLQLHPQHVSYVTRRIRRAGPTLPGEGALLQYLLELNTNASGAGHGGMGSGSGGEEDAQNLDGVGGVRNTDGEAETFESTLLDSVKAPVVSWLRDYSAPDQPGYLCFTARLLQRGMIGGGEALAVARSTYTTLVQQDPSPPPPAHLLAICLVMESLKGHKKEAKLPLPDALLSSLHLLLAAVANTYKPPPLPSCDYNASLIPNTAAHAVLLAPLPTLITTLLAKLQRRTRPDRAHSNIWERFVDTVLSSGLQDRSDLGVSLLSCLRDLTTWQCQVVDGGKAAAEDEVAAVHRNLVTHQHYTPLMMDEVQTPEHSRLKECVVLLQTALLRQSPAACVRDCHVSRILAAYTASTAPHDQALLELLQLYESVGGMNNLLPVSWGRGAMTSYGVGSSAGVMPVLREPQPQHILAHLSVDMLLNTAVNYDRSMDSSPSSRSAVPPEGSSAVYDLRYILPVLQFLARRCQGMRPFPRPQMLAPLLAVAVAGLAAHNTAIRSMAVSLLRSLRVLLDRISVDRLRLHWVWLVDIIRYSIAAGAETAEATFTSGDRQRGSITNTTVDSTDVNVTNISIDNTMDTNDVNASGGASTACSQDKKEGPFAVMPPLPGPLTRFLIEAIMVSHHPEHPMYWQVMNYMFLWPRIRLRQVPELFRLYNNASQASCGPARVLMLRLISEGVRTLDDYIIVKRSPATKLVLALLMAPTSTTIIKVEALAALNTIASTQVGCSRLIRTHALLLLLPLVIAHSNNYAGGKLSISLITLLEVVWNKLVEGSSNNYNSNKNDGKCDSNTENKKTDTKNNDQQRVSKDVEPMVEEEEYYDGEGYYDEYDDQYYDEYDYDEEDEDYDDGEKAKVRKKRKLEAKNRKAAKRAKHEHAIEQKEKLIHIEIKTTTNRRNCNNIDSLVVFDLIQCLFLIVPRVIHNCKSEDAIRVQKLVASIGVYVETRFSTKAVNRTQVVVAMAALITRLQKIIRVATVSL